MTDTSFESVNAELRELMPTGGGVVDAHAHVMTFRDGKLVVVISPG